MKTYNLIIDGGTSKTKFVLLQAEQTIATLEVEVGASQGNAKKENQELQMVVKQTIEKLEKEYQGKIKDVYASGMITSNVGLVEVEHMKAPVCVKDAWRHMKSTILPEISKNIIFHFIPGVKIEKEKIDIMRGEETEVFGLLDESRKYKNLMVLHFGSHNKMISVEKGFITDAVTTMSGEVLWAITKETILKSSVGNMEEAFSLEEAYVIKGYLDSKGKGLTATLFQARIQEVMLHASCEAVKSYLYGAIFADDIKAFSEMDYSKTDEILLYGRETFIKVYQICHTLLPECIKEIPVKEMAFEESRKLSKQGIFYILKAGEYI